MMIRVSILPTQGIFTRSCAGSPHRMFASSTGAAECLDRVDKGLSVAPSTILPPRHPPRRQTMSDAIKTAETVSIHTP